MTGCVFAQLCSHLGIDFKLHESLQNLALNEKIQKYVNILYLSWIHGDLIDLSTGEKIADFSDTHNKFKNRCQKILFENVVLLWGLSSKLKTSEVRECMSKAFGPTSVVSVCRMDETAVFVQLSKTHLVSDFLKLKDTLERDDTPISVLHPLAKLLEGGNTCAADYDTYKEICCSPLSEILFADQAKAVGIKWKTKLVERGAALENEDNKDCRLDDVITALRFVEKTEPTTTDEIVEEPFCAAEVNQVKTASL